MADKELYKCPVCGHEFEQGEYELDYDSGHLVFDCPDCQWFGHDLEVEKRNEMSYDIYVKDKKTGEVLKFDTPRTDLNGGTYALNGTTEAHFNITYNYAGVFILPDVFGEDGIHSIDGLDVVDASEKVANALRAFKYTDGPTENYWDATYGNVKEALRKLLVLLTSFPEGKVEIS